jgi:hypothetical protein
MLTFPETPVALPEKTETTPESAVVPDAPPENIDTVPDVTEFVVVGELYTFIPPLSVEFLISKMDVASEYNAELLALSVWKM